jgi:hypothetical protein
VLADQHGDPLFAMMPEQRKHVAVPEHRHERPLFAKRLADVLAIDLANPPRAGEQPHHDGSEP